MSAQRTSRPSRILAFVRRPWVIGLGTLLLIPLGYGGYKLAKPIAKRWREDKFMGYAQESYTQKKYADAARMLQNIIRSNPTNQAAWELRLKIADAENDETTSAQIISQILRLQPGNLDLRLRLAKFLVGRRAFKDATETLAAIPASQAGRPEVLRLTGEIAMASSDLPLAEKKYSQLLAAVPDDKNARFTLASIALNRNDLITVQEAKDTLRSFLSDPEFHLDSLRLLLTAAIRFNNTNEIREFTSRLSREPSLAFTDRLLVLSGQRLVEKPAYERSLAELKREAESEAEKAGKLAQFFMSNRMFVEAEKFLVSLPEDLANRPEFAFLMSEALFATKDWPTLEQKLRTANWDRVEFLRLAYLAYTLRAQGREKEFEETWGLAVIGANPVPANVRGLLGQAIKWNWRQEVMDLLWKLYERDPSDEETYRQLIDLNMKAGNTAILQRVFARRLEAKPGDIEAKNNLAYLSMLLNTNANQSYRYARDAYESDSKNAYYITSHALALLRQRQKAEALQVFETLTPDQRNNSDRALHYATILAANGKFAEARTALNRAGTIRALPEEKALLDQTRQTINEALGTN